MKKVVVDSGFIKWLSELDKTSGSMAGGKGANLAEMYNSKFPVPPAFVITAQAYDYLITKTGIKDEIKEKIEALDIEDTKQLDTIAKEIRELIEKQEMPEDLKEEIIENYDILGESAKPNNISSAVATILKNTKEDIFVAVRSSATTEDLAAASFAGQQETFVNIKGKSQLIDAVKRCFASLFTARAVYYRKKKGFTHEQALLAVVIQKMINSDKSGVMFSKDPVNQTDNIVIEAVYGLGEGIVSGKILPDHYVVSKDLEIKDKKINNKKIALTRNGAGENITVNLTSERSNSQVLTDYEIKKLADYAEKLESHYGKPQDIEFSIEDKSIYIVQTRPITTQATAKKAEIIGEAILKGLGASPGVGSGTVKIINTLEELEKVKKNDILVTKMTNPDMVVAMQRASGIITDEGGTTSHAAIVSREMGIPCVVGTEQATKLLKDGDQVTVDGSNGKVYRGKSESKKAEIKPIEKTKTEIKVIVDLPDFAERAALTGATAVGLTRLEGIIAESGKHPFYFVKANKIKEYEEIIFKGIKKIAQHFNKIWIRASDIRSDEYRNLEGSRQEIEINPMLGDHGIRFSLKHKDILKAELLACKRIADTGKKVGIMFPQVISMEEVKEAKNIAKELGILKEHIEFGVMIETPAACLIIEEICKEGIDFISFGTNDLTQYTLAIDRGNEDIQNLYNEMHPAVLSELSHVIQVCKKYNVTTSICGQAASKREMAEFLVKQGINSLSVNADAAHTISVLVKDIEEKHATNKLETTEKTLNKVKCSLCNAETEVPFIPDGKRPIYCKICLLKPREEREKLLNTSKIEEKKENLEEQVKEESPSVEIGFDPFSQQTAIEEKENKDYVNTEEIKELEESKIEKENSQSNSEEILDIF